MDKYIGKRLDGRYEILELIGVGGMANVYKAQDITEDRVVAVKILREEFLGNEEFVRRFKNESKAIAILNHPNIVKVYDVIFTPEVQCIVMEFIDGLSLKDYISQQGDLKWRDAVYFTEQILCGLQHAHDRGIVHRDIKPQNIMVLYDGAIKLTDFGIARFARSETRTITDRAIGSVHYISPEQARGDDTDAQADIYSVGIMLFEMLTGRLPFEADNAVSVAIKQIQSIPKRPRELNPDIPEGLEAITIRAMQKEVAYRYGSATEMLHDIDEFKRNPSISFEYRYLAEDETAEISQAMRKGAGAPRRRPPQQAQHHTAQQQAAHGQPARRKTAARAANKEEVVMKKTPVLPVLAGVAGAFLLVSSLFIFWMFYTNNPFESNPEVKLPDFVGERFSTVQQKYGETFRFVREDVYSTEYEAGFVVEQKPSAGSRKVREGSEIRLQVSTGVETVSIQDYTGMDANDVEDRLKAMNIKVSRSNIYHPTVAKGCVIKTDPPKGSEITSDMPVTLYVSLGTEHKMGTVPDLIGLERDDAVAQLAAAGLKMGAISTVSLSDLEADETWQRDEAGEVVLPRDGTVVKQDPTPAGESESAVMVEEGTAVNITIFQGNSAANSQTLVVRVELPNTGKPVRMQAMMEPNVMVKDESNVDPAKSTTWSVAFKSDYSTDNGYIFIDGELWLKLSLDFENHTYERVSDNTSNFEK